jgi:hypothetical protein
LRPRTVSNDTVLISFRYYSRAHTAIPDAHSFFSEKTRKPLEMV